MAITALFQKYGQAKSLKDSEKKQSYQIPVSEALLIVEVEDKVGEKGVVSTPLLTNAQFLYVKALSGVMTSTVKERMQAVQSVLFQYEVETEMEEVSFLTHYISSILYRFMITKPNLWDIPIALHSTITS